MKETSYKLSNAIQKLMNNEKLSTDEIFFIYNNILKNDLKTDCDDGSDKNKKVMDVLFDYFKNNGYVQNAIDLGNIMISNLANDREGKIDKAELINVLAGLEYRKGKYSSSLVHLKEALLIFEELNMKIKISQTFSNMGAIYHALHEYDKSLEVFEKAIKIISEKKHSILYANTINNKGLTLWAMKKYDDALDHFLKAAAIKEKFADEIALINSYVNIAASYIDLGAPEKAKKYIFKAVGMAEKFPYKQANVLKHLAQYYIECGDEKLARQTYGKCLKLFSNGEENHFFVNFYNEFSEFEEKAGNFEKALELKKKAYDLKEKIMLKEAKTELMDIENSFEIMKKLTEAKIIKEKNNELKNTNEQLKKLKNLLQKTNRELKKQATTDDLTNLYNQRYMYEKLNDEIEKSTVSKTSFCLIMIDLDGFKVINDSFGHIAGDEYLKTISSIIRKNLRNKDRAFRYGGDEFLIILPKTCLEVAIKISERIKTKIEVSNLKITLSCGIKEWSGENLKEILKNVDTLLYRAKKGGKNCICCE
jgi:diguanylate cyclase (GGDEF)-like protein